MDNLAAHKDPRVRTHIEAAGAKVIFLPPYPPDSNRIELAWAWVKWWLEVAAARTEDAVNLALATAKSLVTASMARGWIRHRGYSGQPT